MPALRRNGSLTYFKCFLILDKKANNAGDNRTPFGYIANSGRLKLRRDSFISFNSPYPNSMQTVFLDKDILRGGAAIATKAGVTVAGGHSIDDNVPKYGMVVTGTANPAQLVFKKGAHPGDALFLTKPLGSGIITTALEREMAATELEEKIYRLMVHLNQGAANAMLEVGVNACTDITGFGLLGHLHEMLVASNAAAEIQLSKVPIMDEAWEFARAGTVPAGSHNNYRYLKPKITWDEGLSQEARLILNDAQTSGGLLIAVSPEKSDLLQKQLVKETCLSTRQIGKVISGNTGSIVVIT